MSAYNPQSFVSVTLSFTVCLGTHEISHDYSYFCFTYIYIYTILHLYLCLYLASESLYIYKLKFVHFESLSQIVEMADSFPCYLGSMQVYCFWFASKPNAELWIFAKSRGNSDEFAFLCHPTPQSGLQF